MMAIRTAALLGAVALVAAACDNSGDKPRTETSKAPVETKTAPAPAQVPPTAEPPGPGRLDGETLRAAATAEGVERVKLETEKDGSVRYLSVNHKDAAALPGPVKGLLETQYPGGKIVAYETEMVDKHGR